MSATMADYEGALVTLGFIRADGPVNASGSLGRDVSQAGVAGIARQRTGYAGKPFSLKTLAAFSSALSLGQAQVLYAQYKERNVTFADDFGNTWYNLFVIDVTVVNAQRISSGVGQLSGMTHILEAQWDIQSGAVNYA